MVAEISKCKQRLLNYAYLLKNDYLCNNIIQNHIMALTEDLSIYRSMYKLLRLLIRSRNSFDKPFKYVVGDRLVGTALDCVTLIHYANEDRRKGAREEHLDKFLIDFDVLKTLIMVCRDEGQFKKVNILADVFLLTADVEKQASAWRKSTTSRKPESQ